MMQRRFEYKSEGQYICTKTFPKGAYEFSNYEGQIIYSYINGKFVNKLFAQCFWIAEFR